MFEFIKSEQFSYFFSFVLGLALVSLFQPTYTGKKYEIHKAPGIDEMKKTTYRIGSKCYQFTSEIKACPASGVIEAFEERKGCAATAAASS